MHHTQVKEVMKGDPTFIDPSCTLKEAAEEMERIGCGILPVGSSEEPKGIITDRDIVIRALAKGKDVSKEKVSDYMTSEVCSCTLKSTLEQAADEMSNHKVNRLLVKDEQGNICGILTLGAIMRKTRDSDEMQNAVTHAVRQAA